MSPTFPVPPATHLPRIHVSTSHWLRGVALSTNPEMNFRVQKPGPLAKEAPRPLGEDPHSCPQSRGQMESTLPHTATNFK